MKFEILDVTLRDSYAFSELSINLHDVELILQVLQTMNITQIEAGYYNSANFNKQPNFILSGSSDYFSYLQKAYSNNPRLKFYLMLHPDECENIEHLSVLKSDFVYSVRVIYKLKYENLIRKQVERLKSFGKHVCINLTRVTEKSPEELTHFLAFCDELNPDVVYFADSNSAFYPDEVASLFSSVKNKPWHRPLGFHAHNGMHNALLNTLAAVKNGAQMVDTSLLPYGRIGKQNLNVFYFLLYLLKNKQIDINKNEIIRSMKVISEAFNIHVDYNSFLEGLLNLNIDSIEAYSNLHSEEEMLITLINKI